MLHLRFECFLSRLFWFLKSSWTRCWNGLIVRNTDEHVSLELLSRNHRVECNHHDNKYSDSRVTVTYRTSSGEYIWILIRNNVRTMFLIFFSSQKSFSKRNNMKSVHEEDNRRLNLKLIIFWFDNRIYSLLSSDISWIFSSSVSSTSRIRTKQRSWDKRLTFMIQILGFGIGTNFPKHINKPKKYRQFHSVFSSIVKVTFLSPVKMSASLSFVLVTLFASVSTIAFFTQRDASYPYEINLTHSLVRSKNYPRRLCHLLNTEGSVIWLLLESRESRKSICLTLLRRCRYSFRDNIQFNNHLRIFFTAKYELVISVVTWFLCFFLSLWFWDLICVLSVILIQCMSPSPSRTDLLFLNNIHPKKSNNCSDLYCIVTHSFFFTSGNQLSIIDRRVDSLHKSLSSSWISLYLLIIWRIADALIIYFITVSIFFFDQIYFDPLCHREMLVVPPDNSVSFGKGSEERHKNWLLRDCSWLDDWRFRIFGRRPTMFSNKMSKVTPISGFGFLSSAVNLPHKKTNTITNKNPEMQKDDVRLYEDEKTKMKKAEHLHNCRLSCKFEHTQRDAVAHDTTSMRSVSDS